MDKEQPVLQLNALNLPHSYQLLVTRKTTNVIRGGSRGNNGAPHWTARDVH